MVKYFWPVEYQTSGPAQIHVSGKLPTPRTSKGPTNDPGAISDRVAKENLRKSYTDLGVESCMPSELKASAFHKSQ